MIYRVHSEYLDSSWYVNASTAVAARDLVIEYLVQWYSDFREIDLNPELCKELSYPGIVVESRDM